MAGGAAANVEHRISTAERAGGVSDSMQTWRQDRTQNRKPDLASMIVAGQQQVDFVGFRPGKLVGRVGKDDSNRQAARGMRRAGSHICGRTIPGKLIAGQDDGRVADRYWMAGAANVLQPGV